MSVFSSSSISRKAGGGCSSTVKVASSLKTEKKTRQRISTLDELVESERKYVKDLTVICDGFQKEIETKKLLPAEAIGNVFGNCSQLRQVHMTLLKRLERAENALKAARVSGKKIEASALQAEKAMSTAFIEMAPFLKASASYCAGYRRALATLAKHPLKIHAHGLDLVSYLVKPLQRLTKYPLFFRDLAALSEPPGSRCPASDALESVERVAADVNAAVDGARLVEIYQDVFDAHQSIGTLVTPSRKFLKEGRVTSFIIRGGRSTSVQIAALTAHQQQQRPLSAKSFSSPSITSSSIDQSSALPVSPVGTNLNYFLFSDLFLLAIETAPGKCRLRFRFDLAELQCLDAIDPNHDATLFLRFLPSHDGGSFSFEAQPDLASTTDKIDFSLTATSAQDADSLRSVLSQSIQTTQRTRAALSARRSRTM